MSQPATQRPKSPYVDSGALVQLYVRDGRAREGLVNELLQ